MEIRLIVVLFMLYFNFWYIEDFINSLNIVNVCFCLFFVKYGLI